MARLKEICLFIFVFSLFWMAHGAMAMWDENKEELNLSRSSASLSSKKTDSERPEKETGKQTSSHSAEIEELLSRGSFEEIDQEILGLLTRDLTSSSQEDISKITYLNDYLVRNNHKGAIKRKILWLTKGKILGRSVPSFSGYSIKYYGGYLDRVMNDPSLKHAREPSWVFSNSYIPN
jgi:hypothetical protein